MSRAAGSWAAWPRLLLLVVVAVGVVQMHVSGHARADHGIPAEAAPAVAHAMAGSDSLPPDMSAGARADDIPAPGGSGLSLDVLAVCLAILAAAGLATAAMVMLLARVAVPGVGRGIGPLARRWFGRDPTLLAPPLGRWLASLSVLRI